MAKKETKRTFKEGDAVVVKGTAVSTEGDKVTIAITDGEGREVYRMTLDRDHVTGG